MENKQPTGKRSVALPVTLLLLVMSVMGNVLLYTKNIEHSRGQSEEDGLAIFTAFEQAREDLAYWDGLAVRAADETGSSRASAGFLAESLNRNDDGLRALFVQASEHDKDRFAGAPQDYEAYVSSRSETLRTIEAGEGPLSGDERSALDGVTAELAELDGVVGEFHFTGKDSSSVLIRLAGGHDWLDVMEKLWVAIRK